MPLEYSHCDVFKRRSDGSTTRRMINIACSRHYRRDILFFGKWILNVMGISQARLESQAELSVIFSLRYLIAVDG